MPQGLQLEYMPDMISPFGFRRARADPVDFYLVSFSMSLRESVMVVTGQEKVREKIFVQDQGRVREFLF